MISTLESTTFDSDDFESVKLAWNSSSGVLSRTRVSLSPTPSSRIDSDVTSLNSSTSFEDTSSALLTSPTTQTSDDSHSIPDESPYLKSGGTTSSYRAQERYLQFIEPTPVHPPSYASLPPGGCPRFPIQDNAAEPETLPVYSPAVYKVGAVSRKVEWMSPFQPASSRSWSNVIIELNSTQVNFYRIPSHLEGYLLHSQRSIDDGVSKGCTSSSHNSEFTTPRDNHFHSLCVQLGIFPGSTHRTSRSNEFVPLVPETASTKAKESQGQLIRSYSLLHAKVGLAADYSKKPNVLRLRLENEQFLLHFGSTRDLIEWHLGICIGQDVTADISDREVSRYRTVPRRRRGQSCVLEGSPILYQIGSRRSRASSLPTTTSTLRCRFQNVKRKLRSNSVVSIDSFQGEQAAVRSRVESVAGLTGRVQSDPAVCPPQTIVETLDIAEESEDVQDLNDLHQSDEEEEDDEDEDTLRVAHLGPACKNNSHNFSSSMAISDDVKWTCPRKSESERRFLRNCIKCIKPLSFDEPWTNKTLVKATSSSPLDIRYSKFVFEGGDSKELGEGDVGVVSDLGSVPSVHSQKRRLSFTKSSSCRSPKSSPTRTPNHNLREYVVGSHSLVPKAF